MDMHYPWFLKILFPDARHVSIGSLDEESYLGQLFLFFEITPCHQPETSLPALI